MTIDPEVVQTYRRRLRLTQAQLAKRIGCARNTISRAELGECGPKLAAKIVAALSIPISQLSPESGTTLTGPGLTQDERKVISAMRSHIEAAKSIFDFAMGCESMVLRLSKTTKG